MKTALERIIDSIGRSRRGYEFDRMPRDLERAIDALELAVRELEECETAFGRGSDPVIMGIVRARCQEHHGRVRGVIAAIADKLEGKS